MGFAATLEDLSFPEILHLVSFNKKSGRLTLTSRDSHALVVFREGRILYTASNHLRESFGYILLRNGAVTEQDLAEALERQDRLEHDRRLGSLLVQMGLVDGETAQKALRQQAQWVITELVQWRTGFFKFEPLDEGAGLGAADPALPLDGFDTEELLLEAVAVLDEGEGMVVRQPEVDRRARLGDAFRVPPEWDGGERRASWDSLLHDIGSPSFTGEIVLTVLRYATQVVSRGVFLLVSAHEALSVGQFGVDGAALSTRRLWIPLSEPSVFLDVLQSRRSFRGALPHHFWNDHFLEQLGGPRPNEAIVVPMVLEARVAYIFYGDNAPNPRPVGSVQGLEFLMAQASVAMDKLVRGDEVRGPRRPRLPRSSS